MASVITDVDEPTTAETYRGADLEAPILSGPHIALRYGIPGTPYVVVLDAIGVTRAKGTVNNLEQMEGLVDTARRRLEAPVP